jgi:hypothetical protein
MLIYINQFVVSKSKLSDPIKAIPPQLQHEVQRQNYQNQLDKQKFMA